MGVKVELKEGSEIYNHGDMANAAHFGTVTQLKTDRFGTQAKIQPQDGAKPYWVELYNFSVEYKGHAGTRLVTKEAYEAWKQQALAKLKLVGA